MRKENKHKYECYEVLLDGVYESRVFHRNELEKQKVSS